MSLLDVSDQTLMERIAGGDRQAFEQLYDRYSARVFGLILKILNHRSDAEEALQETFWQVWQNAGKYDYQKSAPRAWLFLLARSRAIDQLRRRSRQPVTQEAAPSLATIDNPSQRIETQETGTQLQSALHRLPREQAVSIELAFYSGLTHVQLAQRLDVPIGTVKTRIRSGMHKLRDILQEAVV